MTTTPIFDAPVVEQKFDPCAVLPNSTQAERHRQHQIWAAKAWTDVLAGANQSTNVTPVKRTRKTAPDDSQRARKDGGR